MEKLPSTSLSRPYKSVPPIDDDKEMIFRLPRKPLKAPYYTLMVAHTSSNFATLAISGERIGDGLYTGLN